MSHTHINTKNNWKYITRVHMCVQLSCVYVCIVYTVIVCTRVHMCIYMINSGARYYLFFSKIYIYIEKQIETKRAKERDLVTSYKYVLLRTNTYWVMSVSARLRKNGKRKKEKGGKRGEKGTL